MSLARNDKRSMIASAARGLAVQETSGYRPAGYVATQLPNSGWPGARSSGARGLARPVVPGGVSLLAVLVSTSSVVTNAASIAIIAAIAKSSMAVRWLFRSLFMRDSTLTRNVMRLGWFPRNRLGEEDG